MAEMKKIVRHGRDSSRPRLAVYFGQHFGVGVHWERQYKQMLRAAARGQTVFGFNGV